MKGTHLTDYHRESSEEPRNVHRKMKAVLHSLENTVECYDRFMSQYLDAHVTELSDQ